VQELGFGVCSFSTTKKIKIIDLNYHICILMGINPNNFEVEILS
jgi:hypothetical protein